MGVPLLWLTPLSVSIQANGKKRLILDLRYPSHLRTPKPWFFLLSIVLRIGLFPLISNLVIIIFTFSPQTKSFYGGGGGQEYFRDPVIDQFWCQ